MKLIAIAVITTITIVAGLLAILFGEKPFTGVDVASLAQADVMNGERLYHQINSTGFACVSCHLVDSSEQTVGPSLQDIATIADNRVPEQNAPDYLYLSIARPSKYVIPAFGDQIMPMVYETIYTESELLDLVAYLLTLDGSQTASAVIESEAVLVVGTPDMVATLSRFGRATSGRDLFTETLADGSRCIDCHADVEGFTQGFIGNGTIERQLYDGIIEDHTNGYETILSTSQLYDLIAYMMNPADAVATTMPTLSAIEQGEAMFNTINATGFACVSCHFVDTGDMLVGPGLVQIGRDAGMRVAGQDAEQYLLNAIIAPNDHLVEGYVAMVMPQNYGTIYNERELDQLVSYLMSLGN